MSEDAKSICRDDKCLFCQIIEADEPDKILYKDDEVVVFADIKPASKHHYLVTSKEHIKDAKELKGDIGRKIVEHMVSVGKKMLESESTTDTNTRFGFHWPPFHSVTHLHMHVIYPTEDLSLMGRIIFRPDSWWFVTPEYVLSRL